MITVLAEKPSVARELAALLGATDKKNGYLEGNGYTITWALGHLVSLALPEAYGCSGFHRDALPILPKPFRLAEKNGTASKSNDARSRQLTVIKKLFDKCSSIIVATDAGREGELIFRYIYDYLKCRKPFRRLWISSLTESALQKGFKNLSDGGHFDTLYYAARARSHADWLVGINATQALTLAAGYGIYSLGRVQTPTLALVCQRFLEHCNFSVSKYWTIALTHSKGFREFVSHGENTWEVSADAEQAFESVSRRKVATVTSVTTKKETEPAPLLFDLTGLQKAANARYGLSAAETLEIAQRLYEQKFITYPRTGSKYITEDLWPEIPGLLRGLTAHQDFQQPVKTLKFSELNRHIVNAARVTDHHGLLVTGRLPTALTAQENLVYQLIALRLVEAVAPSCVREVTTILLQVRHYTFTATSSQVLEPGWRAARSDFSDSVTTDLLPEMREGDEIPIKEVQLVEKETRPPQLYTEASLLGAMESAGNILEEADLKEAIQAKGLGTPATRAGIIETLFQRGYMERKGKALQPTDKGLTVYEIVRDKKIASVAMTAAWEHRLSCIEEGSYSAERFEKEIEKYTAVITEELLSVTGIREEIPELTCPKCTAHTLEVNENLLRCTDARCGWMQWRRVCGVQLVAREVENLIVNKSTSLLKGLRSKSGKTFAARLVVNEKAEVVFDFS
ncbi:type IA DNA topoisomerase [Flavobacterium rhizosphaerae]|uniref:DNA topoisomerase n=1 Tax=Flavobacterium rhizosphaerae TaxID=3163298 RepID=A0ABW8Z258_9FLAO